MKTISYTLVFSILYFCACSSTYRLKDGDFTLNRLNDELEGERITTVLTDGKEHDGKNIIVNDHLIYWTDSESGITQSVPSTKINKIITKQHGQGALEGLGIGFLSGFTMGALIGIAITDPDHQSSGFVDLTPRSYIEGALGYGLGFGIPFALLGLPIGAITGHKDIYYINEPPEKLHAPKYVKINVNSIVEEHNTYMIVEKSGYNIRIERSHIKNIDKSGEKIYITIPVEVYEKKFK